MAKVSNSVKTLPNISIACYERYRQQTDERRQRTWT